MEQFHKLCKRVDEWAEAKGIHQNSNAIAQASKTVEECGELVGALAADNPAEIKDALGDILVTLANVSFFVNQDLLECFESAVEIIEARTGNMVDGVFVKDEPVVKQIPVDPDEYEKLMEQSAFLECLMGAGVDNWDGYDYAQEMMGESNE